MILLGSGVGGREPLDLPEAGKWGDAKSRL